MPLWSAERAVDMEMFTFGKTHTIVTRKGNPKDVGEYALHIQCSWRIINEDHVVVASRDLYFSPEGTIDTPDDFDWTVRMGNWRDVQMETFLQRHAANPLLVTSVEARRAGNVSIMFTEDHALEIFPDDSMVGDYSEHWRFFKTTTSESHFVITGNGIET